MFGWVKSFFAQHRAEKKERIDEEYTTMTADERMVVGRGLSGAADEHYGRQAGRIEDAREGRPPAP
jgi:hypothetical protein